MIKLLSRFTAFALLTFMLAGCEEDTIEPELYGSISGLVLTSEGQETISGASVTTSPATSAILTDSKGEFSITEVPVGSYTVSVSKNGFKKNSVTIQVKEERTTQATILLSIDDGSNTAPTIPSNPSPANQASNQPVSIKLAWEANDADNDEIFFDIYLYESNSTEQTLVASNLSDTTYSIENLDFNTTYFWQTVAKDSNGGETNGPVWSFTTVSQPITPIVFARETEGNFEIFAADSAYENLIRLTFNTNRDWSPSFNFNRTKIAYVTDVTSEMQIFTMDRDGKNKVQITTLPIAGYHNNGFGFAWSSDGGDIYYPQYEKLYKISSNGSGLTQISTAPNGRQFREIDVSPIGNGFIALTLGSNIYDGEIVLLDASGNITDTLVTNLPGIVESPSYSPDGQSVMFTRDVSGYENLNGRQLNAQIFIMKLDKSDTVNLSMNKIAGTNDTRPRFSPDGAKIIFENQPNDGSAKKNIWLSDIDGTDRRKIISDGLMPDWK